MTAAKHSSSLSKQRAGPVKRSFFIPATFTIAPSGARLPFSPTTPPVGDDRLVRRADDVLVGIPAHLLQVFGNCAAGHGHAVAVQEAVVEQRLHQERHAARLEHVLGDVAAARLQVGDVGRALENLRDVEEVELDAAFMRDRRQMQRRHWSSRPTRRPRSRRSPAPSA